MIPPVTVELYVHIEFIQFAPPFTIDFLSVDLSLDISITTFISTLKLLKATTSVTPNPDILVFISGIKTDLFYL